MGEAGRRLIPPTYQPCLHTVAGIEIGKIEDFALARCAQRIARVTPLPFGAIGHFVVPREVKEARAVEVRGRSRVVEKLAEAHLGRGVGEHAVQAPRTLAYQAVQGFEVVDQGVRRGRRLRLEREARCQTRVAIGV